MEYRISNAYHIAKIERRQFEKIPLKRREISNTQTASVSLAQRE